MVDAPEALNQHACAVGIGTEASLRRCLLWAMRGFCSVAGGACRLDRRMAGPCATLLWGEVVASSQAVSCLGFASDWLATWPCVPHPQCAWMDGQSLVVCVVSGHHGSFMLLFQSQKEMAVFQV